MKDFNLGNISSIFTNPLYQAGVNITNPRMGKSLAEAALEQRAQQTHQREQQKFEFEREEALRKQQMEKMLPEALKGVDWSDPQAAFQQLVQKGADPQAALTFMSQMNQANLGQQGMNINEENLGLNKQRFGLEKQELGMRGQKNALEMQKLQKEIEGTGQLSQEAKMTATTGMRKEWAPTAKEYRAVVNANDMLKANAKLKTPEGDMAVIYALITSMDSKTGVNDAEVDMAEKNGLSLREQAERLYNKAANGEGLSDEKRKEFIRVGNAIIKAKEKVFKSEENSMKNLAERNGLNSQDVVYHQFEDVAPLDLNEYGKPVKLDTNGLTDADFEAEDRRRGLIK